MTSTKRIRFGAIAAAAAVVAGGFFAAAPANAATPTIALTTTTFTAGDWGTGLDVTGDGFTPGKTVTIAVWDSTFTAIDQHTTTADATGAFHEVYVPAGALPLPAPGVTFGVGAFGDPTERSNIVPLTVLAPKGISTSVTTITTADLANEKAGFDLHAAGYTPGESLRLEAAFDGVKFHTSTEEAAADGSLDLHLWLTGVVEAGTLKITVTGKDSALSQSVSLTVTGETVITDEADGPSIGASAAPAATPAASRLPVVSG